MREVQLASVLSRAGEDWRRRRGAARGALLRLLARGRLFLHPAGVQFPRERLQVRGASGDSAGVLCSRG